MADNENEDPGKTGGEPALTQEQHDAAMADKYRAQLKPPASGSDTASVEGDDKGGKPERPEGIPEKFWDAEKGEVRILDLVKSYTELEKTRGKPAEPPKAGEEGNGEGDGKGEGEGDEGKTPVDMATLSATIATHREAMTEKLVAGKPLEDSDYKPFEDIGFSRDDIDAFVEGQKALGQLARAEVFKEAGGEDAYKAMIEWARETYSDDEVAVYDRDINSGDPAVRLNAARGLAARYAQANGKVGRSVTSKGSERGAEMYRSKAEMVKDMSNPDYAKDQAFRDRVARKVRASYAAGVDLRK